MGEELNTGAENPAAENPAAAKWRNMDVRAQKNTQEDLKKRLLAHKELRTKLQSGEGSGEPGQEELEASLLKGMENAAKYNQFKEDNQLQDVSPSEAWQEYLNPDSAPAEEQSEEESLDEAKLREARENRRLEATQERRDLNHEQTESEKLLEAREKRIKSIEEELLKAEGDKSKLMGVLKETEAALEENSMKHESLSSKADNLEREIKQCKRKVLSKIAKFSKTAIKALATGEFWRISAAALDVDMDASKGDDAKESLKETQDEIEANESEGVELEERREDTIDQITVINNKAARLAREKAKLEKESEELRGIIYEEAWEEMIAEAEGDSNAKGTLRATKREQMELNKELDKDLELVTPDEEKQKALERWDNTPGTKSTIARENASAERAKANIETYRSERNADFEMRTNILKGLARSESILHSLARFKAEIMKKRKLARLRQSTQF